MGDHIRPDALKENDDDRGRGSVGSLTAALLAVVVLLLGGCGGGNATVTGTETAGTGTDTGEPPIPEADTSDPESTLYQLWDWIRLGAIPAAASLYDRSVGKEIGPEALSLGLRQQIPLLKIQTPEIVETQEVGRSTLVTVRRVEGDVEKMGSFLLTEDETGHWEIGYDSFLGDAILAFARQRAEAKAGPDGGPPSPGAIAAETRLVERYDARFGRGLKLPSRDESRTAGQAATTEEAPPRGE